MEFPLPDKIMTTDDVVDYVVELFGADPSRRSVARSESRQRSCVYNGPGGRCCAFAVFVEPELRGTLTEKTGAANNMRVAKAPLLRKQVQHITNGAFWNLVQCLHDVTAYWSDQGLTQKGLEFAQHIKKEFAHLNG